MIRVVQATTVQQLNDVVALRRSAFEDVFRPGALYLDESDLRGVVLVAYRQDGTAVGTVRLTVVGSTCALSMLTLSKTRPHGVFIRLVAAITRYCEHKGLHRTYATANCGDKRMWERLGAESAGPPAYVEEYGVTACPLQATVKSFREYLDRKRIDV